MALLKKIDFAEDNPTLAKIFQEYKGKDVYYYPNPGNGGDSMIAAATYQLFAKYGINVKIISPNDAITGKTIFFGGGGNLVPMYKTMAWAISRFLNKKNRLIVLSHSIRGNKEIFDSFGPDDAICCREVESYSHVVDMDLKCQVLLTHDLALYLDADSLSDSSGSQALGLSFSDLLTTEAKLPMDRLVGKPISCIRYGVEKTFKPKGANYDISTVFRPGVQPGQAETGAWMMLAFCRLASQITTNRLHVGVAAALAGTPLILYDNSYGKVSGVYKHSLRGRFSNIEFRETPTSAE